VFGDHNNKGKEKAMYRENDFSNDDLAVSVQGLKGRQSVRATFRLPEQSIRLLGTVARQLGLKQKSLFDQLVEDRDTLARLAAGNRKAFTRREERRQKTYVLSKRSLETLDSVARMQNIPRDLLVEITIHRLLPIMNAEQRKHGLRCGLLEEIRQCRKHCRTLLDSARNRLGGDDRATLILEKMAAACEEGERELENVVRAGQAVEDYRQR